MKKSYLSALALVVVAPLAQADLAETKGGVVIRTEDGRFQAKFGGRIHLDVNVPVDDDEARFDNGAFVEDTQATDVFFRRARLTLEGKAYGWAYKFENDFAGQDDVSGSGFREMWIGTQLLGANLRIGQAKPYRGMEELTSSNEITFMERPNATATTLYGSRQYLLGAYLDGAGSNWGWGLSGYNLKRAEDSETDGVGFTGRGYFAPLMSATSVVHVGLSASIDNPTNGLSVSTSSVRFMGRSGESQSLNASSTDEQTTFGLELAGSAGPLRVQGEYAMATFAQEVGDDIDVNTYYVQATYLLTGETRPYDVKKGVFKSPKPKSEIGAWELKVRYDFIDNENVATEREVTQLIAGLNWFVNPSVRMMFEYISGENEPESGVKESGDVFAARLQFAF